MEFLSFCVTQHLHDGGESYNVGLKSDLFRGILLSKQLKMYEKKYDCNVYEFLNG